MLSADAAFVDDLERAVRSLRSAAAGALLVGITPEQIARVVAGGIGDVAGFTGPIQRCRDRIEGLGYQVSDGKVTVPAAPPDERGDEDRPGRLPFLQWRARGNAA